MRAFRLFCAVIFAATQTGCGLFLEAVFSGGDDDDDGPGDPCLIVAAQGEDPEYVSCEEQPVVSVLISEMQTFTVTTRGARGTVTLSVPSVPGDVQVTLIQPVDEADSGELHIEGVSPTASVTFDLVAEAGGFYETKTITVVVTPRTRLYGDVEVVSNGATTLATDCLSNGTPGIERLLRLRSNLLVEEHVAAGFTRTTGIGETSYCPVSVAMDVSRAYVLGRPVNGDGGSVIFSVDFAQSSRPELVAELASSATRIRVADGNAWVNGSGGGLQQVNLGDGTVVTVGPPMLAHDFALESATTVLALSGASIQRWTFSGSSQGAVGTLTCVGPLEDGSPGPRIELAGTSLVTSALESLDTSTGVTTDLRTGELSTASECNYEGYALAGGGPTWITARQDQYGDGILENVDPLAREPIATLDLEQEQAMVVGTSDQWSYVVRATETARIDNSTGTEFPGALSPASSYQFRDAYYEVGGAAIALESSSAYSRVVRISPAGVVTDLNASFMGGRRIVPETATTALVADDLYGLSRVELTDGDTTGILTEIGLSAFAFETATTGFGVSGAELVYVNVSAGTYETVDDGVPGSDLVWANDRLYVADDAGLIEMAFDDPDGPTRRRYLVQRPVAIDASPSGDVYVLVDEAVAAGQELIRFDF